MAQGKYRGSIGDYGSHFPVLAAAVAATKGPVLELGVGDWSTPLLHLMCGAMGRRLVSAETDQGWMMKYYHDYNKPGVHEFHHVPQWQTWNVPESERWGVAFMDLFPGEYRHTMIQRLAPHADLIVAHDSERDHGTGANYMYEKVIPLFKYVTEYRRFRPYTLILSNTIEFPIDDTDKVWYPISAAQDLGGLA